MAEKTVLITQQLLKPIKVTKWKVSSGNSISIGSVILLYDFEGATAKEQRKLKSTRAGTVHELIAPEGAIVPPGEPLLKLQACIHPTVMKDMCAECGADLRMEETLMTASVPMVHSIPDLKVSEELAQKLGRADGERLLRDRKLVLLVDLDQTLIHTTNDNIPVNIKDVYHFQLYGPNSPWYHTRLRPGTHQFLSNVSPFFELHICTFGARNYAHMITMFLDGDQRYFSNRILSRDECFDPTSKKANLKALFPCGDNMVCIIDDREDVWNHASNLIHVKPYHFFQHTGDINAPPGLDKHEQDDKEGFDLSKIKKKPTKPNGKNVNNGETNGLTNKQKTAQKTDERQSDDRNAEVESTESNKDEENCVDGNKIKTLKIMDETEIDDKNIGEEKMEVECDEDKQQQNVEQHEKLLEKRAQSKDEKSKKSDVGKNTEQTHDEIDENIEEVVTAGDKTCENKKSTNTTRGLSEKTHLDSTDSKLTNKDTKEIQEKQVKNKIHDSILLRNKKNSEVEEIKISDKEKAVCKSEVDILKSRGVEENNIENDGKKTEVIDKKIFNQEEIDNNIPNQEDSDNKIPNQEDSKMEVNKGNISNQAGANNEMEITKKNISNQEGSDDKTKVVDNKTTNQEGFDNKIERNVKQEGSENKMESTNINEEFVEKAETFEEKIKPENLDKPQEISEEYRKEVNQVGENKPNLNSDGDVKMTEVENAMPEISEENRKEVNPADKSKPNLNNEEDVKMIEVESERTNSEKKTVDSKKPDEMIEIEDPDDYLLHLEDILRRIHQTFYEEYDRMESGIVPDLKRVIPDVRSKILQGTKLVFSGLVPTHVKLQQSKAYQVARSLGAVVTQDLDTETTHLVAVRPGTAKVNAGRRKRNLKIVTPDWLWACAERWEHVEEAIFPLNSKGSKNRHPPPHCSSPEHVAGYPVHETPGARKRTPSGRFMDTINPLMSFSSDDIADMDKEVEDILDDESDESEDNSQKQPDTAEQPPPQKEPLIPAEEESSSSSEESLTGEYPRGFKRTRDKRKLESLNNLEEDDQMDSSLDEFPSAKFRRGEQLDSDLDIGQESNSEGSAEAPDEVDDGEWNMMGAALEREFLSNN